MSQPEREPIKIANIEQFQQLFSRQEDLYENYHFEEEVREHDVIFNYVLKKGRVTTRNAIRLLEMIGYDQEIIQSATKAVQEFESLGTWRKIENAGE